MSDRGAASGDVGRAAREGRTGTLLGVVGACISGILAQSAAAGAPPTAVPATPSLDPTDSATGGTPDAGGSAQDAQGSDSAKSLNQVTVNGVRPLLHDKLGEDAQHTPQSVSVVSQEVMSAQADTRLADALKNVPGISAECRRGRGARRYRESARILRLQ